MKLKNREIINIINQLESVNKAGIQMPGQIGYTMKQNKKRLLTEYSAYEESLNAIEADKDSPEWQEQVTDLLNAEAEVPIATVDPSLLFAKDYDPVLFEALDFMLEEPQAAE